MKPVRQADVAKAAGVSRGLVSLALSGSGRVAPETVERIQKVARELGYSRNFTAATLASARSTLVGVVLPNLRNPYFESLVSAYQNEADRRGLLTLAATAAGHLGRLERLLDQFDQLRVRGIILVTPDQDSLVYQSIAERYPVVAAGVPLTHELISTVHIDEFKAARLIAHHAVDTGCTQVVYVTNDQTDASTRYRLAAIEQETDSSGLKLEHYTIRDGRLGELTSREATCYLVQNDLMAIDVVAYLKASGARPGIDFPVMSYDNTYLAENPQFLFTSIDQDPAQQAQLSFDLIEANRQVGTERVVEPRLIVRASSRNLARS